MNEDIIKTEEIGDYRIKITRLEVAPCGIGDVFGGRMWFCVKPDNPREVARFCTKRECEQYIRKEHHSDPHLLKVLRNTHGRAFIYA